MSKPNRMKKNLRKLAHNQECQIRLPGVCNYDSSTTVLAHVQIEGCGKMGAKHNDFLAAWACSACHDAIDGRIKTQYTRDQLVGEALRGMWRTQEQILKMEAK